MRSATIKNSWIKNLALTLVLMLGVVFGFCACGINTAFDDGPTSTDIVTGNGTSSIVYGDYVYYTNGYQSYADVADTNVYGKVTYSGVYRTKLVDGKVVEKEKQRDEDGNEIFDKTQAIENTGLLVSKVCGYEYTKLYIFDNYLYYTTPGNQVSKDGSIQNDHMDFCRMKIDGKTRAEKLFTSDSTMASITFYMYKYGNYAYLVVLDGNVLKIAECSKNGYNLKTLDSSYVVSSVAQTRYTRSDEVVSAIDGAVYFTYTTEDTSTGNLLAKYDLTTKQISNVGLVNDSTYTLLSSIGGRLYYNKQQQTTPGTSGAYLYYNTLNGATFNATEYQLTNNAYSASNIYVLNSDGIGAFINDGSNIYKFALDGTKTRIVEGSATIVAQKGDLLFYTLDNALYSLDLLSSESTKILDLGDNDAVKNTLSVVSKSLVFYMKEYTNSEHTAYYMHMHDTSIQTDDGVYDHFIGVLDEKDYLDEPEK